MTIYAANTALFDKFYNGNTGLVQASFTATLLRDGSATAESLTITEDALGWYELNFTPLATGQYTLKVDYSGITYTAEYTVAAIASSEHQAGAAIYQQFYVGTTGLTSGDFTKLLENNNAATAVTMTITEASAGWYNVSFTPDVSGNWIGRIDYVDNHIKIAAMVAAAPVITLAESLDVTITPLSLTVDVAAQNLTFDIS